MNRGRSIYPAILDTYLKETDILFKDMFTFTDPFHVVLPDSCLKYPIMDVKYDNDNLYLVFVVNGIDKKDIDISLTDDIIEVRYEKPHATKHDKLKNDLEYTYIHQKISKKAFAVKWKINASVFELNDDAIKSDLKNGELTITVPIKEEKKPKKPVKINIK